MNIDYKEKSKIEFSEELNSELEKNDFRRNKIS